MNRIIILSAFLLINTLGFGQINDSLVLKRSILKTNALNLIMLPSVHFEGQIAEKTSIQLNLHRGSIVFISPNEWLNASIIYRKYMSSKKDLQGVYVGAGLTFHHNFLKSWYDSTYHQDYQTGASYLGPEVRAGYQTKIKQSRWYFDGNLGYALPAIALNKRYSPEDGQARLMLGIGYSF